jgi:hypothetical protein
MRELVLAIGAAMVVGSVAVIVKERRRPPKDKSPRANMKVVALNLFLGSIMTLWGLGSMIAARHGAA